MAKTRKTKRLRKYVPYINAGILITGAILMLISQIILRKEKTCFLTFLGACLLGIWLFSYSLTQTVSGNERLLKMVKYIAGDAVSAGMLCVFLPLLILVYENFTICFALTILIAILLSIFFFSISGTYRILHELTEDKMGAINKIEQLISAVASFITVFTVVLHVVQYIVSRLMTA